jgi:predicted Zn-dependent protease with MMP-like domain
MKKNDKILEEKIQDVYDKVVSKFAEELDINQPNLIIEYPKGKDEESSTCLACCFCDFIYNRKKIIIGIDPKHIALYPEKIKKVFNDYDVNITEKVFLTHVTIVLIHETFHLYQYYYKFKNFIGKDIKIMDDDSELVQKLEKENLKFCFKYISKKFKEELSQKLNEFFFYTSHVYCKSLTKEQLEKYQKYMESLVIKINELSNSDDNKSKITKKQEKKAEEKNNENE